MSINKIELSSHLLGSLYAHSLVETGEVRAKVSAFTISEEPLAEPQKQPPKKAGTLVDSSSKENASTVIKFLGNNNQKLLIVVNYPEHLHIPDNSLSFLTQLLTAIKMNIGDIALVNFAKHTHIPYREWLNFLDSKQVFLFGVEPSVWGLPINFPHFQVQPYSGLQLIHAPSLEAIQADKLLKTKLWLNLKTVFNL